jgi:hypothetical protein
MAGFRAGSTAITSEKENGSETVLKNKNEVPMWRVKPHGDCFLHNHYEYRLSPCEPV